MTSVISKQSKPLYEDTKVLHEKMTSLHVRYALRQKQEDDDRSIGISIHLPGSSFVSFSFLLFLYWRAHLRHIAPGNGRKHHERGTGSSRELIHANN